MAAHHGPRLMVEMYVEDVRIKLSGSDDGIGAKLSQETLNALSLSPDARLIQCVSCGSLFIARAGLHSCSERCAKACFDKHMSQALRGGTPLTST